MTCGLQIEPASYEEHTTATTFSVFGGQQRMLVQRMTHTSTARQSTCADVAADQLLSLAVDRGRGIISLPTVDSAAGGKVSK